MSTYKKWNVGQAWDEHVVKYPGRIYGFAQEWTEEMLGTYPERFACTECCTHFYRYVMPGKCDHFARKGEGTKCPKCGVAMRELRRTFYRMERYNHRTPWWRRKLLREPDRTWYTIGRGWEAPYFD